MMENEIKYDMGGSTSPKELKGYSVRIFTNNLFGSAQNIVSSGNDRAILVTDGKTGDSSTVMSNEPYLLLSKMEFRGRTSISAKPVNYGNEGKHKMFGGAFVWSSDSRFRNDVAEYPVPLHDRVEYKDGGGIDYSEFLNDEPSYVDAEDWEKISKRIEAKESAKHKHLGTHKQFTDWWYSGGEAIAMKKYGPDRITAWSEAYEDFKNDASYKNGGNISEENQSKIAKLEKVVASTMVPDSVKEQAKAEIERLRSESSMEESGNENSMNNSELNKEVYRIVKDNKINDKDSFEQIVSEVLTDSNNHAEAFKFATILDKSIKTKEDWYKSERFVADDENRKVALKISNLSQWDANYFGPALEFTLKMNGFHQIADALKKALSTDATNNYPNAIDEITKRQGEYAQEIANRTGLRQGAVAEWIANNGLNEKETLNLLQGLGMKKLDPKDFMTAVVGTPNNEYETKLVAFAKSNEAFKTPSPAPTQIAKSKAITKGNLSSFAKYISKRNIKYVVVEIDGKELTFNNADIVDGVYVLKDKITEAKPSKKTPKVTRTQFEEEEFEFGKGGKVEIRPASKYSKKYIVFDKESQMPWANEKFSSIKEAEDFIKQNNIQMAHGGGVGDNLQVELGAYKGGGSNAVAIKFQRFSIKNIDEAINLVRRFINENDLGMGEFVGAQIYENNKAIAYISYNLRVWKGEIGNMDSEPYKFAKGGGVALKKVPEIDYYSNEWKNKTTEEKKAFEKKLLDEAGIGVNDIVFEERNGKKYFGKVFETIRESDWPSTYYVNLMRNTEGSPSNSNAKISGFSLYKKYHGFNTKGKKPLTFSDKLRSIDLPNRVTLKFLIDHPIIINSANKSAFIARNQGEPDIIEQQIKDCIYVNTFDNSFYKYRKDDNINNFGKKYVDLYYKHIFNPMTENIDEAIEKYFDVSVKESKGDSKRNEIILTYKDKTKPDKFNINWFKSADYIPNDLRKELLEFNGIKNFKMAKSESNKMVEGGKILGWKHKK